MINLEDTHQHVHFVGIGGVGVSAIAEILHNRGFRVSGSDAKSSPLTENLADKGMAITYGHKAELVEDAEFIVYTTAVNEQHPELARALELGIPCISRPEMLGMLMDEYKISIAVSGAHGKTTTSSMIAMALVKTHMDPTILIGGEVKDLGTNALVGASDIMVAEACEYKESFLSFHPTVAVLLNIDADHLDYYKDIHHIVSAFERYVEGLPTHGALIYNGDDPLCRQVALKASCTTKISFGMTDASDFYPTEIKANENQALDFTLNYPGGHYKLCLKIPGEHNVYNAMAAFAAATFTKADLNAIAEELSNFNGAVRRFDAKGYYNGAFVVDDYAHHPSEVKATLKAAKAMSYKKIICIFQPHTYTRTYELMEEFTGAFTDADEIIITDIFASREQDQGLVHASELAQRIEALGQKVKYISSFQEILDYLEGHLSDGDLLFTMGAGNVSDLGPALISRIG